MINSNITITGGAGYIGSILIPHLLSHGYHVTVVDNFKYNQTSLLDHLINPNLNLIYADARDERVIKDAIKSADFIIPLAALVGAPSCDFNKHEAVTLNFDAVKLINTLRSNQQYVIFPMTNSGYGIGKPGIPCVETDPLNPISLYGQTKSKAETLLLNSGNAVSLRLATVFGLSPRMRLDLLVNDFTYRACTDRFVVLYEAHAKRNYIHVRDVARAFLHTILNITTMNNNVFNLGLDSANLSKLELCLKIKEYVPNFYIHTNDYDSDVDKRDYIVSNEKILSTGYVTSQTIDSGILELVKGYAILKNNKFNNL